MISQIPEDNWQDAVRSLAGCISTTTVEKKDDVFAALKKKNVKITKGEYPGGDPAVYPGLDRAVHGGKQP